MIKRIKAPKFKVGRYSLNEYELRQLQLDVAKGEHPGGMKVKDLSSGVVTTMLECGMLADALPGLAFMDEPVLEFHSIRRKKERGIL